MGANRPKANANCGRIRTSRSSSKPSESRQSAAVSRMHSNLGCHSKISLTRVYRFDNLASQPSVREL